MNALNPVLLSAKEQGYKGTDSSEAFEWVRAKAKNLDMSQAARMARAKAMGRDRFSASLTESRSRCNR
jgi:hypothetical protein